jgi:hypothetical protein
LTAAIAVYLGLCQAPHPVIPTIPKMLRCGDGSAPLNL